MHGTHRGPAQWFSSIMIVFAWTLTGLAAEPAQAPAGTAVPGATSNGSADPAAQVLEFERQIEDAVVRGDVAFIDKAIPADFSFVHGDGWTTGGRALATDDKAAFVKRVAEKEYLIHDLDAVKTEIHGDVVITYGRYVSLFMPRNRNNSAPGRLNSIWFMRVYAKRNGQWQFLSHRTVNGPNVAPAGVDPSASR